MSISTAFKLCGTAANLSVDNNPDWTDVNNIKILDGSYATCTVLKDGLSDYLCASNFGFVVPVNAKIVGVEVKVTLSSSFPDSIEDDHVRLTLSASTTEVGSNLATNTHVTMTYQELTYGGATNLWGTTLTPAQVNASGFGVNFGAIARGTEPSAYCHLKYFQVVVYYEMSWGQKILSLSVPSKIMELAGTTIHRILSVPFPRGYAMGGLSGASVSSSAIDDFHFTAETSSVLAAILDVTRGYGSGVNSKWKGYCMGGYHIETPSVQGVIDDLNFATETSSQIWDSMDTPSLGGTPFSSSTRGYCLGGYSSANLNSIQLLIFSTEAAGTVGNFLPWAQRGAGGVHSGTKGFTLGGLISSAVNSIIGFVFSTETAAAETDTLEAADDLQACVNASAKGYAMGALTNTSVNWIDDLTYATAVSARLSATLDTARAGGAGVNTTDKGYCLGGLAVSSNYTALIDDLNFTTETSAQIAATLDTGRTWIAGVAPNRY